MPIPAYDSSIAMFVRGLINLKTLLQKAEQHAVSRSTPAAELLEARLAPDMHKLASQVHWVAEGAKLAAARLVGAAPATTPDDATTFAELQRRVDATIAHLQTVSPQDLEAGLSRTIEIEYPSGSLKYTGDKFLHEFAIPTFFFHLTCAYAILRHQGVELNKSDYTGRWR